MLILVRPSSTLMCTTSPIAAAGAIVGSRPGAGSSTMPRTTLPWRACPAASGGKSAATRQTANAETAAARRAGVAWWARSRVDGIGGSGRGDRRRDFKDLRAGRRPKASARAAERIERDLRRPAEQLLRQRFAERRRVLEAVPGARRDQGDRLRIGTWAN